MDKTITDTLVKRVKEFKNKPEKVQEYLDFVAKCPNYSYRNLLLIQSQYPSAKYVGSYNHFKDKGFHVMRGEKGIKILSPKFKKHVNVDGKLLPLNKVDKSVQEKVKNNEIKAVDKVYGYKPVTVFDVTQTNAKADDLPEYYPNRREKLYTSSPNATEHVFKALQSFAEDNNIKTVDNYTNNTYQNNSIGGAEKGVSIQTKDEEQIIGIRQGLEPEEKNHTYIHELTHALHHHKASDHLTKQEEETEAEMVAYIVSKHYGIEPGESSIKYISDYSQNMKDLKDTKNTINRVTNISRNFINQIDKHIDFEHLEELQKTETFEVEEKDTTHKREDKSESLTEKEDKNKFIKLTKEDKQIARNKSIIDVLNQNGHDIVHSNGKYYKDETNPNIYVNSEKNIYYDSSKKQGGDPIRFLVNNGMRYPDAVMSLKQDNYQDKQDFTTKKQTTKSMKDKIKIAEEKSILEVASFAGQSFERTGSFYKGVEHDSLMIKPKDNAFFWNSRRGEKNWSGSPIQFIQNPDLAGELYREDFKDAVELLNSDDFGNSDNIKIEKTTPDFKYDENNYVKRIDGFKSYNYLVEERKINTQLVDDLQDQNLIKQDHHNNVAFLWKDAEDNVVGQDLRGTSEKPFKKIETNHGNFGFNFTPSKTEPDNLLIFEAPIDAMSYASLHPEEKNAYASMSGLKEKNVYHQVHHFVKKYEKEPDNIYLCVDNDEPGKEFVSRMTQDVKFQFKSQKDVVFQPNLPNKGKDWNDYLKIVTNDQDIKQTQNVQIEHEQPVKAEQSEKEDINNYQNKKKKTFLIVPLHRKNQTMT
ncbi:toprim domain-containing protein (plasmid) [Staphylococcus epidermidis]|nr:toprim domain-containing protein [Staphylococcus epidermidis]